MLRTLGFGRSWKFAFRSPCSCLSSSNNNGQSEKSSVDIDKVVGSLKLAEEKVDTGVNTALRGSDLQISETTVPRCLDDSCANSAEELFAATKSNIEDGSKRRRSTASRLVPWTSNRFLKEYRPVKPARRLDRVFATMLRECAFVQLGDFCHREVVGVVVENVNDSDLYVDFGGKFLAVVSQPENAFYPRGSLVRVRLRDPEMANRFMINTRAISLLEADVTLLGPYRGHLSKVEDTSTHRGNRDFISIDHFKLP